MATDSHALGSWLMRFSSSEKGGFAFTVVEVGSIVTHYRVSRENGEYVLRMKAADRRFSTLSLLVRGAMDALKLSTPISGSVVQKYLTANHPAELMHFRFVRSTLIHLTNALVAKGAL